MLGPPARWASLALLLCPLAACHLPTSSLLDEDAGAEPDGAPPPPADGCIPAPDLCDGVDNDCDPSTPDGSGDPMLEQACDGPDEDGCEEGVWVCTAGGLSCNDTTGDSLEQCANGLDDDCDGEIDEDDPRTAPSWYRDADGDGHGDPLGLRITCGHPDGYVATDDDCDDSDPAVSPDATEVCNARDDNCSGAVDDGGACPCPVEEHDGRAYLFCNVESHWTDARDGCRGVGYQLTSIGSADEQTWLVERVRSYAARGWWIGFNDRDEEDTWVWVNGEPVTYTRWADGQPDNARGDWWTAENCAEINWGSGGEWNDSTCDASKPFVCEGP